MVQIIARGKDVASSLSCRLITILIRCYQLFISPMLPMSCRFYPSCSEYCTTAVLQLGVFHGLWKSLGRILRCHPWSLGGYDPVLPNEEKQ